MITEETVVLPEHTEVDAGYESQMVANGVLRYEAKAKRANKAGELTKPQTNLLEASIQAVAAEIRKVLKEAQEASGGRGRPITWVLPVSLVDADVLAYIALNQAFVTVLKKAEVRNAVAAIGEQVEMEVWAKQLHLNDPETYKKLTKQACKNIDTHAQRLKMVVAQAEKKGHAYMPWDEEYRAHIGGILLNAVQTATDIFRDDERYTNAKVSKNYLIFAEGAQAYIDDLNGSLSLLRPMFLPMLTQPKPWTSMFTGSYHDDRLASRVQLIRTSNQKQIKMVQEAIDAGKMDDFMKAINAIQAVPLRINEDMYRLLKHLWDNRIPVKGLPAMVKFAYPEYPGDEAWLATPLEAKKLWNREKKTAQIKNRAMESDALQIKQDLETAKNLLGKPFALPTSCDFRGRVYPVPAFNHQRTDHIRNLFEFANGKPLGEEGARWLAIHIASTGDFDKVSKASFEARIAWTHANTTMIQEIGNDPQGTVEQWACADKPFSFVAACIVWARYCKEGPDCIVHLPLPLDGSNSGCQHLSAQTLDEKAGFLVNLAKSDEPQDLYGAVAALCAAQVEKDAAQAGDDQEDALKWQAFGVTRKVVKRSVMVFAYSSEKYGFRDQIITDLMDPLADQVLRGMLDMHPFGDLLEANKAAGYMAKLIWDAVHIIIERPAEAMRFLKECSGLLAHEGKPMTWVTPVGLPVLNMYEEFENKEVGIYLHDRTVKVADAKVRDKVTKEGAVEKRMTIHFNSKPTGVILKAKSRSTIAANWTHSHDSAHLMLAVNAAVDAGMTDLLLIHDSFSTHACDAGLFQRLIKRTFVSMYQAQDVLKELRNRIQADISEENRAKVPALPEYGLLDLEGIMESDYCFS